jgi:hypothetical protein
MSPATTKIAKHAQSTWNDWRRKNFIELCIDTETAWSVNDPLTSRLALGARQIRRWRQNEWEDCGIIQFQILLGFVEADDHDDTGFRCDAGQRDETNYDRGAVVLA